MPIRATSNSVPTHTCKPKLVKVNAWRQLSVRWTRLLWSKWRRTLKAAQLIHRCIRTKSTLCTSSSTAQSTCWYLACNRCNPLNSPSFTVNWRSNFTPIKTHTIWQRRRSKGFSAQWTRLRLWLECNRHSTAKRPGHRFSEQEFFKSLIFWPIELSGSSPPSLVWFKSKRRCI